VREEDRDVMRWFSGGGGDARSNRLPRWAPDRSKCTVLQSFAESYVVGVSGGAACVVMATDKSQHPMAAKHANAQNEQ